MGPRLENELRELSTAAVVVERIDDNHHRRQIATARLPQPLERLEGAGER